jgi:signal peptidase II
LLKVRNYILLIFLAGVVVVLDQLTKQLVRTQLAPGEIWMPIAAIRPYMHIGYWTNTGAAFSMFRQGGLLFAILAIVVSAAIIYYYRNSENIDWLVRIALGLQLGGALGNLLDRLTHGLAVTDFIWFGFFPAVFNLADAAISLGVFLLLLDVLVEFIRIRKTQPVTLAPISPEKA